MALASNPSWAAFDTNLFSLNQSSPPPSGYIAPNTNVIATRAWVSDNFSGGSSGYYVPLTNGTARGLTRTGSSTNLAIPQPSAGSTNVEAINSSGVEIAVPFADFSGGGSGDFGFTNGINTNAPVGVYVYDTNHFGIGTNSPVGNKPFGSASTNNTGDFDTNGAAPASSIITSNALVSTINALPYTINLSSTNGIFTPTATGGGQTNWTFTITNLAGLDTNALAYIPNPFDTNTTANANAYGSTLWDALGAASTVLTFLTGGTTPLVRTNENRAVNLSSPANSYTGGITNAIVHVGSSGTGKLIITNDAGESLSFLWASAGNKRWVITDNSSSASIQIQTNNTVLITDGSGLGNLTLASGVVSANGNGLTNIPISGLNTNTGSAGCRFVPKSGRAT